MILRHVVAKSIIYPLYEIWGISRHQLDQCWWLVFPVFDQWDMIWILNCKISGRKKKAKDNNHIAIGLNLEQGSNYIFLLFRCILFWFQISYPLQMMLEHQIYRLLVQLVQKEVSEPLWFYSNEELISRDKCFHTKRS